MARPDRSSPPPLTPAAFHHLLAIAEGPRHGYAVMQAVERTSGRLPGPGTVYGTLQRLEASGWVEEVAAPGGEDDDPRRRYFALTAAGRTALEGEARRLRDLAELARRHRLLPEGP